MARVVLFVPSMPSPIDVRRPPIPLERMPIADVLSVGDAGSQAVAIAKDLLHLADIKILHGQDHGVAADLEQLIGLGPIARDVVTGWAMHGKGRALWCVGDQQYKVATILHSAETALTYTNDAITGAA